MSPIAIATKYPIQIRPDVMTDGSSCFVAEHPDLPGCVAYAETAEEAEFLLADAREAYLDSLRLTGESVPPPSRAPSRVEFAATVPTRAPSRWAITSGAAAFEATATL
jgi:predicted RNase H-like HicB family nuclease